MTSNSSEKQFDDGDNNNNHGASDLDRTKNLPSEQDRKATLGCIAAVLNIMFEHRFPRRAPSTTSLTTSARSSSSSKGRISSTTTTAGSGGGDNINDMGVSKQRTREFQEELLFMSSHLLYLEPVHAVEFLPLLDNRIDGESNRRNGDTDTDDDDDDDNTTARETSSASECFLLEPFLSSFSDAGAAFHCISLLLFRFLLSSRNDDYEARDANDGETESQNGSSAKRRQKTKSIVGYDSRVRYAFKYASVSVLNFWDPVCGRSGSGAAPSYVSAAASGRKHATRKYEALEDAIAHRISILSNRILSDGDNTPKKEASQTESSPRQAGRMATREIKRKNQLVRGLKIGTAAIGAGALMAISGGIAVPAIVGGIAAAAGVTALSFGTLAAISILVLPAAVTIFGVGSGVLVATKMSHRTMGLTNFAIEPATTTTAAAAAVDKSAATPTGKNTRKKDRNKSGRADPKQQQQQQQQQQQKPRPKLTRTICINGWIADEHDFERPFGTHPKSLKDESELLKRFCSVYAPEVIPNCDDILEEWKSSEAELWRMLRDAYGRDPSGLYPLDSSRNDDNTLTEDENKSMDSVMRTVMGIQPDLLQTLEEELRSIIEEDNEKNTRPLHTISLLDDVLNVKKKKKRPNDDTDDDILETKKYRSYAAWDFQSTYRGMELYTISWEKQLLLQLNGSAKDLQMDLAMKGAEQVMKKTVLATLMSAVAIPAALLGLTNLIDEKWVIANERADEAGILLAESLLMSTAGHRPINLIGVSFGARMIVSCLTELSRHQRKWENEQKSTQHNNRRGRFGLLRAGEAIKKSISDGVASKMSKKSDSHANERTTTSYLREPASIIETVILMGCPASVKLSTWKSIRGVVAGPIINCYAGNDLMLALMYRLKNPTTALLNPPVGITEIKDCGVTNYDVSSLINSNHGEYCFVVRDILDRVGFDQPRGG